MVDRSFLIQLTNTVYRLTLLFPKKEPLRYKMREVADDILAKPNERDLEILDSFFEVALIQNWVKPTDILAIKEEYDNLREQLKGNKPEQEIEEGKPSSLPFAIAREKKEITIFNHNNSDAKFHNDETKRKKKMEFSPSRKEKILAFLRENEKAQVWQMKELLPEVSKRTLRRDFEVLLGQGLIKRVGERNNTFYTLVDI